MREGSDVIAMAKGGPSMSYDGTTGTMKTARLFGPAYQAYRNACHVGCGVNFDVDLGQEPKLPPTTLAATKYLASRKTYAAVILD